MNTFVICGLLLSACVATLSLGCTQATKGVDNGAVRGQFRVDVIKRARDDKEAFRYKIESLDPTSTWCEVTLYSSNEQISRNKINLGIILTEAYNRIASEATTLTDTKSRDRGPDSQWIEIEFRLNDNVGSRTISIVGDEGDMFTKIWKSETCTKKIMSCLSDDQPTSYRFPVSEASLGGSYYPGILPPPAPK